MSEGTRGSRMTAENTTAESGPLNVEELGRRLPDVWLFRADEWARVRKEIPPSRTFADPDASFCGRPVVIAASEVEYQACLRELRNTHETIGVLDAEKETP